MHSTYDQQRKSADDASFDDAATSHTDVDRRNGDDSRYVEGPSAEARSQEVLTTENLVRQMDSCSDCGVSWSDDHVTLDCGECGGYALQRPCPCCGGSCANAWRRDITASHMNKAASWLGSCSLSSYQWKSQNISQQPQNPVSKAPSYNGHSGYCEVRLLTKNSTVYC